MTDRPNWAHTHYPPVHSDPREEINDVMREMQQAMLGEARGPRADWTLAELATYCLRVRDAAIELQMREVGRPIMGDPVAEGERDCYPPRNALDRVLDVDPGLELDRDLKKSLEENE